MKSLLLPATAILCAFIIAAAIACNGRYQSAGAGGVWIIDTWTGKVCKVHVKNDQNSPEDSCLYL